LKYIYFDAAAVNTAWLAKANAAKAEAAAKPDDKSKQAFIAGKSVIWREFKPILEHLSDGKCWYSEARDKVSYWAVDHYRPKKIYPWLAFDWRNFRLCGGKPNRQKTDQFPLEDEASRASAASPDTRNECPLLLDPVRWGDPELLTFKADGEPTCAIPADEISVRRVRETVSALELDSAILCEERREKWRRCETKLKKLRELVEGARQRENPDAAAFSRELCRDIAELYDERAEFTSTANACSEELHAGRLVELARALSQRAPEHAARGIGASGCAGSGL
jgi:uncharacterized protein (TIGR02646 family)